MLIVISIILGSALLCRISVNSIEFTPIEVLILTSADIYFDINVDIDITSMFTSHRFDINVDVDISTLLFILKTCALMRML